MSDDIVIKVENLSKQYRIGAKEDYKTFRETLVDAAKAPFARISGAMRKALSAKRSSPDSMRHAPGAMRSSQRDDHIWALKDVSFEVKRGEVIGIIGRNGAGKSTLLKILSKITEPTEGRVELRGRVGSLLEVGTGFHPELTGHENVYLYGAILGMDRWEVTRKFDEIVAFAELEKFIETPVKRYSSGMYMRLAFAVAAFMETEILLVDEVLAVGDVAFQKKCLGKMGDISKEGRTVLFVSHNMAAINRLCPSSVWLDKGTVREVGSTENVVASYLSLGTELEGERRWEGIEKAPGNDMIRLKRVSLLDSHGEVTSNIDVQYNFFVEIEYVLLQPLVGLQVGFSISTYDGIVVFVGGDNEDSRWLGKVKGQGKYKSKCKIPALLLNSGIYYLGVASDLRNTEILFSLESVIRLQVEQTIIPAHSTSRPAGIVCPFLGWEIQRLE